MDPKTTDRAVRLISIPLGAAGLFIIAASLQAYYKLLTDAVREGFSDPFDLLFFIPFNTLILAVGLFAIYTTIKTWTDLNASRIRSLSAIAAVVFGGVILSNYPQYVNPHVQTIPEPVRFLLCSLIFLILTVLFYLSVSRWLIAKSSCAQEPPQPASPNLVGLFCFFIWVDLVNLVAELAPELSGQTDLSKMAWEMFGFLASILLAWALYKAILHLSARRIKRYEQSRPHVSTPA
jgi:hypothetical protein